MKAVVSLGSRDPPFTRIEAVDVPEPLPNQMLVKTVAVAANPTDWKHISLLGTKGVVGSDGAGVVESVGEEVTGFKVGDVVSSFARGAVDFKYGRFADYFIASPDTTIKHEFDHSKAVLPESISECLLDSFDAVAGITLGLATIGVSFSHNLQINSGSRGSKGPKQWILIWGGSTATGILGIQIAKLVYGLNVVVTCSPKNFEYLKSLGADEVFDYNDPETVANIGKLPVKWALDTVSSTETLQKVYDACNKDTVAIDNLLSVQQGDITTDNDKPIKFVATSVYSVLGIADAPGYDPNNDPMENYRKFWYELLPPVIGKLRCARPLVLEPGLESGEKALLMLRNSEVSGQKIIWRV